MDVSDAVLFALVALIGMNQFVVRTAWVRREPRAYWALNILDAVVGVAVLIFGLPGYGHAPIVSWVVGLLLVMHVAQNLHLRSQWDQEAREEGKRLRDLERKARRQDRDAATRSAAQRAAEE